ncbi:MAG: PAS domain S-box protein [Nitrospiraceae bacterium]|nr:MAG: PAS domain S-box protein [Nitrospiraceae bacterium]
MKVRGNRKNVKDTLLIKNSSNNFLPKDAVSSLLQNTLMSEEDNVKPAHLYENILDSITSGVWVSDKEDIIFYANKGMEMIAGVTHQKLVGYHVLSGREDPIDHFRKYYLEAKKTLQTVHYSEVPVVTPAGKLTYQSGWLIPRLKYNEYDGMICILEDITNQKEIRKALHKSETQYRELVENVSSIIMRLDMEGNIIFVNDFARKFFGYDQDEILFRNLIGTIAPDNAFSEHVIGDLLKNISSNPEQYAKWEFENVRKDGGAVWISWTSRPIFTENRRVVEILCVGNDISELKSNEKLLNKCRADLEEKVRVRTAQLSMANETLQQEISEHKWVEERLRKSEEKYRLVIENANEAITVVQDGMCKYLNPKAEKLLGYSKEELMSSSFIDLLVHPHDKDLVRERYFKRIKGDTVPSIYSFRIVDKESNVKWLQTNSVLISWMGRPAALAFFSNITERKKTEESLRLLESAFQQAKDSIVITTASPVSPSAKVVFVNPAFTEITGYTAEEVMEDPSIILQSPQTNKADWIKLEKRQSKDKAFSIETKSRSKNGTEIDLEWQITPLKDEFGRITHFVSIHRDITQRKEAEEREVAYKNQLRSLASELSLAEEKERRRIAIMLHDHIGQTLAISKIKLGALQESLTSGSYDEYINDIHTLLEKSIQYTKSLTFELSPPILYELGFESAIEWFGEQIQKHHNIIVEVTDDGTPKPLDRDVSVLLFQMVRELFMNIVKHAHAQNVRISIRRDNTTLIITVEDDGIGFNENDINTTKSFGFFSIYERLRYIGGTVEIHSKPGHGTQISLKVPFSRSVEVK